MSVMNKLMNTKLNKKGFTLAELLIVVAIIAVLVAISIPIFTTQLEKSRESTDAANLRAAYATAAAAVLESETGVAAGPVAMTQTTEGFASAVKDSKIGTVALSSVAAKKGGTDGTNDNLYVNVGTDGTVTIGSATANYTVVNPTTGKTN